MCNQTVGNRNIREQKNGCLYLLPVGQWWILTSFDMTPHYFTRAGSKANCWIDERTVTNILLCRFKSKLYLPGNMYELLLLNRVVTWFKSLGAPSRIQQSSKAVSTCKFKKSRRLKSMYIFGFQKRFIIA